MSESLILVVEDNPITEKMLRLALESAGYAVLAAHDGRTALRLTENRCPDLVLQDLVLPDVSGFDLVTRMRARPGWDEIPILACSGFVTALEEARLSATGFDDFISKPIEPSRLVELIRTYLPLNGSGAPDLFGSGRRLLLADDDPVQLKMINVRLHQAGFDVMTATDGFEALERAQVFRPDVIVTDVLMPHLDGFGLCLAVREDPRLAHVPVILVTSSYVEEADRELGRRAGADHFVVRRPDLSELVDALRDSVGRSHEAAPTEGDMEAENLDADRADRVVRQLERQVALHAGVVQRCSTLAAELSILSGISEALSRSGDLRVALDEALVTSLDAGGISRGALYRRTGDAEFSIAGHAGFPAEESRQLVGFFGHPELLARIAGDGRPLILPSDSGSDDVGQSLLDAAGARSLLMVPILCRGENLGALLFASDSKDLSDRDWLNFATAVAGQIGQAMALARAFERVSESEARFRSLVGSMDDLVFTLDREQRYTGVFGRGRERLSVAPAALLGKTAREVLGAEAALPHERAYALALAGKPILYEWEATADGGHRCFQASLAPLEDGGGRTIGIVGISRDISEQKRIHARLMASDRMASVGTLAAGIAHGLNNPLASVLTNLELAARDVALASGRSGRLGQLEDEVRDALEAAESVRRIVRDLKVLSRADDDRAGPVDVRRVLESSLRIAWNEIRHRAELIEEYGSVPLVDGNEAHLCQIFLNLIVNAAQAIPEGQAPANQIRVKTRTDATGRVVVTVADTGSGIPPELHDRIFDPFFTTKELGAATGLGLSICHRLVTGLGGQIVMESEVGRGTVFEVTLPSARRAETAAKASPARLPAARRGRILCVDDDVLLTKALTRALNGEHEVTALTRAREALERVMAGERYDVILCDLMMPEMGGIDLHAELLGCAPEQAASIIFLTGGAFTARARDFLASVPNQRVEKPFDIQLLRTFINDRIR